MSEPTEAQSLARSIAQIQAIQDATGANLQRKIMPIIQAFIDKHKPQPDWQADAQKGREYLRLMGTTECGCNRIATMYAVAAYVKAHHNSLNAVATAT